MLIPDSIATTDTLGREVFAKQIVKSLTNFLTEDSESFVVGINGKWGSGKSTLLSLIQKQLDEFYQKDNNRYKVLHFDSWSSNDEETLERDFLETILEELSTHKWEKPITGANEKLKSYLKYLGHIKFIKHIHPVAKSLMDAIEDYEQGSKIHSIKEIKQQANELLTTNNVKLYILIDNLDRLTSEEITRLFKILKVNLNLANTFYIIAYDKDVIVTALDRQFTNDGERYLEKIIQADFAVPQILTLQLEEMFFSRLRDYQTMLKLTFDENSLFTLWKHRGLKEYFNSIRDLNRYFNSLTFSLPNIGRDINISDFLVLEAIKVFDNNAYERLFKDITLNKRKAKWSETKFDQKKIDEYPNETTKALLVYLFLSLSSGIDTVTPSHKRLRDPEFFERYYTLHLSTVDIAEESVDSFFSLDTDKKGLLKFVWESNKMQSFLRRLADRELPIKDIGIRNNLFSPFLTFWDTQRNIQSEYTSLIRDSYFNLINCYADSHKAAQLSVRELMLHTGQQQSARFLINHFIYFHFKSREVLLNSELCKQVAIQKSMLTKNLKEYISNQSHNYIWALKHDEQGWISNTFLHAFANLIPGEYEKLLLEDYLKDARFLLFVLDHNFFMFEAGTKQPGMVKYDSKAWLFPNHSFNTFVSALTKIEEGELNNEEHRRVSFFLKSHEETIKSEG